MIGFTLSFSVLLLNVFISDAYVPATVNPAKESVWRWKFRDTTIDFVDFSKANKDVKISVPVNKQSIGNIQKCFSDVYPTPSNNLPELKLILTTATTCIAKVLFGEEEKLKWIEFDGKNDDEMQLGKYREFKVAVRALRKQQCLEDPEQVRQQSKVVLTIINNTTVPARALLMQSQFTGISTTTYASYSTSTQHQHTIGFSFENLFGFIGGGLDYTYQSEDYESNKNTTTEETTKLIKIQDTFIVNPKDVRNFTSYIHEMSSIKKTAIPIELTGYLAFSLDKGDYQGKKLWILPVVELTKLFNEFQRIKNKSDRAMVIVTILEQSKYLNEEAKESDFVMDYTPTFVELCSERKEEIFTNSRSWTNSE